MATRLEKLKLLLYARKSSESEDRQVQSIEDQTNRLTDLAKIVGIEIVEILSEAKSAKKPGNRSVFDTLLKRIEKGEADGILCWSINRLSRNPIDSGRISWMLQQGIIKCIQTIDRKYLPDDNVLLFNVESGMANQYIIDLRKVCRRGMEGKAERGWLPSTAPLGYINDKAEGTIVPDSERFDAVRKMWDMLLTGVHTPQQIKKIANKEWGFRTPKHKRIGGKELSDSLIYKLFGNLFYTGMFKWGGQLYEGKHKPMITLAQYDQAQILLGRRGNPRPQHHSFAFTGIIRCARCGSMITATEKKKFVKSTDQYATYVYYHCTKKKAAGKCNNQPITAIEATKQIEGKLEMYRIAPEFLEWGLTILRDEKDKDAADTESVGKMRQKSLEAAEKELEALTRMRYKELIDDEAFIKERDILRTSIARLKMEIKTVNDNSEQWLILSERALNFVAHAYDQFQNGGKEAQKEICHAIGSNYKLNDKRILFEASVWLIPIAKAYPDLIEEYRLLELQKYLNAELWNAGLASIIQRWCTIVEEVRTAIKDTNNPDLYIPDLSNSELTKSAKGIYSAHET